jgi:hypothetical protein
MDITTYILAKKYTDQTVKEAQLGNSDALNKFYSEENLLALTEEEILEICKERNVTNG